MLFASPLATLKSSSSTVPESVAVRQVSVKENCTSATLCSELSSVMTALSSMLYVVPTAFVLVVDISKAEEPSNVMKSSHRAPVILQYALNSFVVKQGAPGVNVTVGKNSVEGVKLGMSYVTV